MKLKTENPEVTAVVVEEVVEVKEKKDSPKDKLKKDLQDVLRKRLDLIEKSARETRELLCDLLCLNEDDN